MKRVLVPLAPGFEEIEALTIIDILRRGDVKVITAGTVDGYIEGLNQVKVLADISLDEVNPDEFDMIVLPGGQPGVDNLKNDSRVHRIIKSLHEKGRFTAAICAAPTVLSAVGILDGKRVTSYPTSKKDLSMTEYSEDRVVVDGHIITSRSPGTAMEFAIKLLEILCDRETMERVSQGVLAKL